jgi:hypothetical protein
MERRGAVAQRPAQGHSRNVGPGVGWRAVARFLADPEATEASLRAYVVWAKRRADAPSGPTMKNVFGTWNEAKAAAEGKR